ncbi:selenium cofactor biosynthesis protein YqeC [Cetobacterium somerae]|uniref:selenium cofactor biosynthesis protein YqeC n=1 Tax=Cetobacterium sp. NK01 TaxID=2993530 RepID=UPI00211699AA|nr:selenium cofactor biosynthesis protein YqeC [Cetobacterium sp. NK01]MCQ8213045.1 selenium cofactor biosynthesis protein YqeC [Cetobacterium sp. NK01]
MKKKFNFAEAFDLEVGDIISVTGGGGKTSLISKLAKELSQNYRVLITTTTKIYLPKIEEYENFILERKTENKNTIEKQGTCKNIDYLAEEIDYKNKKIIGVNDKTLEKVLKNYDFILIESDGSKGKSLKVWRENEPVISKYSNKIIGVINLNVLNTKVKDSVYRYESIINKENKQEKKITSNFIVKYIKTGNFFRNMIDKDCKKIEKYLFINGIEDWKKLNAGIKICNNLNKENIPIILGSIRKELNFQLKKE